ncbi:MAG: hypothetical protein PHV59_08905, partial [Victivallales bacterium]|nr:hypothetical protein [Victivallales bacterium]
KIVKPAHFVGKDSSEKFFCKRLKLHKKYNSSELHLPCPVESCKIWFFSEYPISNYLFFTQREIYSQHANN